MCALEYKTSDAQPTGTCVRKSPRVKTLRFARRPQGCALSPSERSVTAHSYCRKGKSAAALQGIR